jgi:hypothetical protein
MGWNILFSLNSSKAGVYKLLSQSTPNPFLFYSDLFILVEVTNDGQSELGTALHSAEL